MKPHVSSMRGQQGNALVYTLLGLVIAGIGLAVGVSQFSDGERSTSAQATISEVNTIIGNAKENYGGLNYAGVTTAGAVSGRVIPESLHVTAATANNKYSGAITLVDNSATVPGTAVLTYQNIPREACAKLVIGTQALAVQVQVAGVDVKALAAPVNVAALNAQCSSAAVVPVAWTIGRS